MVVLSVNHFNTMNSENKESKNEALPEKNEVEPKSAHATPVVEKYIEKRNTKADKQIKNEGQGNSHAD